MHTGINQKFDMSLKEFAQQVLAYSYHMKLVLERNGTPNHIVPKYRPIHEVLDGESMQNYLDKIVSDYSPTRVIIWGAKRNGSGIINPKEFVFDVPTPVALNENKPDYVPQYQPIHGIGSTTHISSSADPRADMYKFQYDIVNRDYQKQTAEFEALKAKHETLKETFSTLKRDFDTQEAKFDLERQKAQFDQNNTLLAVAKEFRPEINGLMGVLGEKITGKTSQPTLSGGNDKSMLAYIMTNLSELDLPSLQWSFELVVRSFNLPADKRAEFMNNLREQTASVTNDINNAINQFNEK